VSGVTSGNTRLHSNDPGLTNYMAEKVEIVLQFQSNSHRLISA
jgi:hypothetical protein